MSVILSFVRKYHVSLFRAFGVFAAVAFFGSDALPLVIFAGPVTGTPDVREREDLSPVIDTLMLNDDDMRYLSFVNFLPRISDLFGISVRAPKHEWQDSNIRPRVVLSGTSGAGLLWNSTGVIAALPVNSGQIARLRVGDVILLPNGEEQVIVKSINTGANTIDVYARGHGGTTATAQPTTAFNLTIVGNAQAEDSDPVVYKAEAPVDNYNYCQIFEEVVGETGTMRRSKQVTGDFLDFAIARGLKEQLMLLNRALIHGRRNLDGTNKIGAMGGLRQFIANTYNVAGAMTLAKLYGALETHLAAGLFPSQIHGSVRAISAIEQLFAGNVVKSTDDQRAGLTVSVVNMMGYDVKLLPDRDMLTAEAFIVDRNRNAYGPLDGGEYESGEFAVYPLLDKKHGKQVAKQILGEYTADCRQGSGTRLYGIS